MSSSSLVVFDFDDTLVASEHLKLRAFEKFANSFGLSLTEVLYDSKHEKRNRFDFVDAVLEKATAEDSCSPKRGDLANELSIELDRAVAGAPALRGVTTLLERLLIMKVPVFLNSSTPLKNLQFQVDSRGWGHFFRGVFGGPNSKSQNLDAIIETCNCISKQCLIVGDSEDDAIYASGAGAQFCRVPNTDADVFFLVSEFLEIDVCKT